MRTGNAVDGCAIFWRSNRFDFLTLLRVIHYGIWFVFSHCHCIRFKLVQEESIQFNQLGLRDNVAQICVFEVIWIPYVNSDFHTFCFFSPKLKTLLM